MSFRFDEDVVLVTGAGGGMGAAICRAFLDAGAKVVATDIPVQIEKSRGALPGVEWRPLDVTSESDWAAVIAHLAERYGRLDVLVNNAGINIIGPMSDLSLADWRRCQSINVDGVFLGLKSAQNLLAQSGVNRAGGASVINLSSAAGITGAAFNVTYCASKGGVRLLSKAAALEYAALKLAIRVNSVHPGPIHTDMMKLVMDRYVELGVAPSTETAYATFNNSVPLGRHGEPKEVAAGILFLASTAASYVTGSELVIDGGFTTG